MTERFTEIKWGQHIIQAPVDVPERIEARLRAAMDEMWKRPATTNNAWQDQLPLTEAVLRDLIRKVMGPPTYRVSDHVPADAIYEIQPQSIIYGHQPEKMMIVGKRAARGVEWEVSEKKRWEGRDRRRIKRERRRFVKGSR